MQQTEGLSFTEAVRALSEKKCEGIENEHGTKYFENKVGTLSLGGREEIGIKSSLEGFLGKWKLIGVKQKFVIEGVGWGKHCIDGTIYPSSHADGLNWSKFLNKPGMKMTLEWPE